MPRRRPTRNARGGHGPSLDDEAWIGPVKVKNEHSFGYATNVGNLRSGIFHFLPYASGMAAKPSEIGLRANPMRHRHTKSKDKMMLLYYNHNYHESEEQSEGNGEEGHHPSSPTVF